MEYSELDFYARQEILLKAISSLKKEYFLEKAVKKHGKEKGETVSYKEFLKRVDKYVKEWR